MLHWIRRRFISFSRRQDGAVTVEFAILCTVFLLLVFGVGDFGHAWYMKQIITNASREGARYATRYQTNGAGDHILPNALTPSISNWILANYTSLLPPDANLSVAVTGAGFTTGAAGQPVNVTVNARKNWLFIDNLVPSLGSGLDLSSSTVMNCE